jgi:hypothetical protein
MDIDRRRPRVVCTRHRRGPPDPAEVKFEDYRCPTVWLVISSPLTKAIRPKYEVGRVLPDTFYTLSLRNYFVAVLRRHVQRPPQKPTIVLLAGLNKENDNRKLTVRIG